MAGIRKVQDRYSSDVGLAKRSTREMFSIIVSNFTTIDRIDADGKIEEFLDSITGEVERGEDLLEWQVSKIEDIYERIMRAQGLPSVRVHQDRRRKGLKFG